MSTVAGKVAALEGLITASRRHAQRRNQRPTTAHCVLAMMQTDTDTARILAASGVREADFISALHLCSDEADFVLERVADRALKIVQKQSGGTPVVRAVHMLAAITTEPRSAAMMCFERLGISIARLHQELSLAILGPLPNEPTGVETSPAPRSTPPPAPVLSTTSRARAEGPVQLSLGASRTSAPYLGPESKRTPLRSTPTKNRRVKAPETEVAQAEAAPDVEALGPFELDPKSFPLLTKLGRNLTSLAARGALDPVLGRDNETEQALDVIARRRGNNPLLVGPPGVGKTAIVEGIAQRIVEGGGVGAKIIIEITPGALASGTGVRGAMGEKIRRLRDEVERSEGRVLLFLDEIHALVGEAAGPDDIATELKGALARGELACIGATTEAEHKKHFDRDPALARRFSLIHVEEPTAAAATCILRGLMARYEAHHAVVYGAGSVEAAVELSVRFLPERCLPDKAIGVLDLAGARVHRRGASLVEVADVARVIADEAKVPVERLLLRDGERLAKLETHLAERVVGQREPLLRIADALRKGAAGFRGRRPLATFLLLGTTGVGKTETAKAIADLLFSPGAMTRFDMSEFSEAHTVARLLGAPPGYVGHEAGGQLTEAARKRPYQLILLDEVEKAHPEVLLALLPLLDEGRLTDGRGRTVDFTNTVIVMTSNLGAAAAFQKPSRSIGFDAPQAPVGAETERASRVLEAARRALPAELWNRIDEPLFFAPLVEEDVIAIADRLLTQLAQTLRVERGIAVSHDASAAHALARAGGFEATLGARPMKRTIGRLVESPLARMILTGELKSTHRVRILGEGASIRFDVANVRASHEDVVVAAE
jgi:ATP-dependent Clp protease ATP-binding subunit ClpC